mmetsp:Transcript_75531/g.212769  ORF Transcript_75531/g.212769 Transcript_75531/m.212769 type:complete len:294 (-) Transcript_75531:315-1196(-)
MSVQVPQLDDNLPEQWPIGWVLTDAPKYKFCKSLRKGHRKMTSRIEHLHYLRRASLDVANQIAKLVWLVRTRNGRWSPCQDFQYKHAVTVHLAPLGDDTASYVLWACVSNGATCLCNLVVRATGDARQAEVCHLGGSIPVQEDVGSLDIPVECPRGHVVKVRQSTCSINDSAEPSVPFKRLRVLPAPLQALAHITARKVLVDQAPSASVNVPGETHKDYKVRMAEAGQDLYLLFEASFLRNLQDLDCNLSAIAHDALVDTAERARAEQFLRVEVAGRIPNIILRILDAHVIQV